MEFTHLNSENFKEFITENKLVIIDFFATWCGPCKMLSPVLEELSNELSIPVGKVDVDECEDLAKAFEVSSIPTLLLYQDGKVVKKRLGYCGLEELKEWVSVNA